MKLDKKTKQAEWLRTHTLSKEQLQKLLDDKMKRAHDLHQQLSRQQMLIQQHR
jgi:hypothetical protein